MPITVRPFRVLIALLLTLPLQSWVRAGAVLRAGTELHTGLIIVAMNGYDFVPSTNQSLTALGFFDEASNGLPAAFQVGLWETGTQTLLASALIDNSDPLDASVTIANGQYRYELLASPIALSSGTTYTLGFQAGNQVLSEFDSLILNWLSLVTDPNVTIGNERRFAGTFAFTFPTNVIAANDAFPGLVNARLIPEPAALALPAFLILARSRRY